ncbi:MAG: Eco57I restriction-modification methylase domain-containing protein [Candidatus Hermodarchaeota archaeon]
MNTQKEGTVYTPENIANYIAKTAIEKFLLKKINKKFSTNISNLNKFFKKEKKKFNNRNKIFDRSITKSKREWLNYIFEILLSLKILDPAVGSGQFIIAALDFLEEYYLNLKNLGIINWSKSKIREYIISNSLFGVDIEIEAIIMTKRRLLSKFEDLITNTKENKVLHDLNSHFKTGNAIIGYIKQLEITTPSCTDLDSRFYEEIKSIFESNKNLRKIELTEKEKKEMVFNLKPFHWFYEFPEIMQKGGFDIIIENPPYISNKQLSYLEKAIYQNRYKTPKGLMNVFGIFIERSIELCHSSSIISFIIHKNMIRSNNYDLLRKYLLEHTTIQEIIDVGAGAFQSITAETVIIILTTITPSEEHKILIKTKFANQNKYTPKDVLLKQIPQKIYLTQENYNFNLELQDDELEIINYIKNTKDCDLIKYFEAKTCIATGNDKKFLADHKIDSSYKKTLKGKNIGCYYIDFDDLYVFYDAKALHRARDENIFQKPEKLIMQTISSNLTVAYDNNNYYPLSTCIAIIPKDDMDNGFNIKYLLLLMNSKLMNFYYDFVFNLGAQLTTEISVNNINRLPLKLLDNYELFIILADIMIHLNEKEAVRENNKDYVEFLDDLINCLIIGIFFSDKFHSDGLNIDLINLIAQNIMNKNLNTIPQIQVCIKDIQDDKDICKEIQYIKNHSWAKIVDEYFKKRQI